jgi:YD repeat-containing protein
MSKLGVNQSYQHLHVVSHTIRAYRTETDGKTIYEYDKLGRVVRIITTESQRKQKRNEDPGKVKEIKVALGFLPGDVGGHLVGLNSGGVDDVRNISRMTHECNSFLYRYHEKNYETIRDQIGSEEVITRVIKIHYEHSVKEISRMKEQGKNPDLYKTKAYEHNFYTGTKNNETNFYKSGVIPNWSGQQARRFYMKNTDSRKNEEK